MSIPVAHATEQLRGTLAELRAKGLTSGDALNALAAVAGELVGEVAAPEFEQRLARNFLDRVMAHARRR